MGGVFSNLHMTHPEFMHVHKVTINGTTLLNKHHLHESNEESGKFALLVFV